MTDIALLRAENEALKALNAELADSLQTVLDRFVFVGQVHDTPGEIQRMIETAQALITKAKGVQS